MPFTFAETGIIGDAETILNRLISLADGKLACPEEDDTRIYSSAPSLISIRYILDRALGAPGVRVHEQQNTAHWCIYTALRDIQDRLASIGDADLLGPDGPFKPILAESLKRKLQLSELKENLEQSVIDYIPTAITRLIDLCSGVTVRTWKKRKPKKGESEDSPHLSVYTDTQRKPDRNAIKYLIRRVAGAKSVYDSINEVQLSLPGKIDEDDTQYLDWQEQILLDQDIKERSKVSVPAANLFDSITGEPDPDTRLQLPEYYTDAARYLTGNLPFALGRLSILAEGAVTRIVRNNGEDFENIQHAPDPIANTMLLNHLYGPPQSRLNVPWSSRWDKENAAQSIKAVLTRVLKKCGDRAEEAGKLIEQFITTTNRLRTPRWSAF